MARSKNPDVELKCWPEQFAAVLNGTKRHEVRVEDRHRFVPGDLVRLHEWNPRSRHDDKYTGRHIDVRVTHVTRGPDFGMPAGMAVMSIDLGPFCRCRPR